MIIVKIIGGLGNQMFQYAFYRELAKNYSDVKMDINSYNVYKLHNGYELDKVFNINAEYAVKEEICRLAESHLNNNIFNKVRRKVFGRKRSHYIQKEFSYNIDFLKNNDIYLEGYWQSEKFFEKARDTILKEFTFKNELDSKNQGISYQINITNSISIHIRRGDYITNKNAEKLYGGICDLLYYKKSIEFMEQNTSNPYYFVFSDDINWAKSNLKIKNCTYIDWNKKGDSYIDMQLMSLCKHNIIANSSFSWWGAWLNNNQNKIIIAPSKWFNDSNIKTKDIVPEAWIKI